MLDNETINIIKTIPTKIKLTLVGKEEIIEMLKHYDNILYVKNMEQNMIEVFNIYFDSENITIYFEYLDLFDEWKLENIELDMVRDEVIFSFDLKTFYTYGSRTKKLSSILNEKTN